MNQSGGGRLGRGIAAFGVVAAASFVAAIPTAAAASGDSVTLNHAGHLTLHHHKNVSVVGTAQADCGSGSPVVRDVKLSLVGPAGYHSRTKTLQSARRTCQQAVALTDDLKAPKRNGTYSVELLNGSQTTSARLVVLIPAATPKNFTVRTSGTTAAFTWTANNEPDVTAYQVVTTYGYVVTTVAPTQSCSGSSCAAAVNMGDRASGSTVKFQIHALRCGRSCSHSVAGHDSAPQSGSFSGPPAPPPSPAPSPITAPPGSATGTSGNGTGSGFGGASGGGTVPGGTGPTHHHAGRHGHRGGRTQVPGTKTSPGVGASSGPVSSSGSRRSSASADVSNALGGRVWRGIAAAVVLLLVAFHLRTWVKRVEPA